MQNGVKKMVSTLGYLDGLSAFAILLSSGLIGLYTIYKAKKLGANLLYFAGGTMIFVGFLWLGPSLDLMTLLTTGHNILFPYIYGWLSYMWVAPALVFAMYLGSELILPEAKYYVTGVYLVLGIVFELFLFTDPQGTFILYPPENVGDLINVGFNMGHPTFILIAIFLLSALIFLGFGFAYKAKQSVGTLRKKFAFLSIGFIIFVVCGALDSILELIFIVGIVRLVMATFAIWMYLGLRT
jgi:hypothetical protein